MNKVIYINNYNPSNTDKFFFDTNIWMFLYYPNGNYGQAMARQYDSFLKKIINAKSSVFVSSLVLSEFFNSYLRREFNRLHEKHPAKYKDFKKSFKGTKEYKELVEDIRCITHNQILKNMQKTDDDFCKINTAEFFDNIAQFDFNDKYYQALAFNKNFKIVTHDGDFAALNRNLQVITANKKLLKHM